MTQTLRTIADADVRQQIGDLFRRIDDLSVPLMKQVIAVGTEANKIVDEMQARHRQELNDALKPFRERAAALKLEMEAAIVPHRNEIARLCGDRQLMAMEQGEDPVCALTGLAIFADDDVIKDEGSLNVILSEVLPWPEVPEGSVEIKEAADAWA